MQVLPVDRRVTVLISAGLFCLFVSRFCLAEGARSKSIQLGDSETSPGENNTPQKCEKDKPLDLTLKGESESFLFNCPGTTKLYPVEAQSQAVVQQDLTPEKKIYELSPSEKSAGNCVTTKVGDLSKYAPGSTLEKTKKQAEELPASHGAGAQPVFNLTLVSAQTEDKHFCYICNKETEERTTTPECNVFVTVPGKKASLPPSTGDSDGETDGNTDHQTESGSFALSMSSWSIVSVAACALGWMYHL